MWKSALRCCGIATVLFFLGQAINATAAEAIRALHDENITVVMATGDNERTAKAIAKRLGIDQVRANMLPEHKSALIEELRSRGVLSYCLTLDPEADRYVERIFGANHYTIIDHVQRLPEKLPLLYAGLTR